MISDVMVWPLKRNHPKIKANGVFTVNGAFKVKFAIMNGEKGLWVSLPGKKADKPNDEGKFPWYADVECIDADARKEMNEACIAAYNAATGNGPDSQGPSPEPEDQSSGGNIPF